MSSVLIARFATDESVAKHLAQLIEQGLDGLAVSAFEAGNRWMLEVILPAESDRDRLDALLEQRLGQTLEFEFEPLAERDWVHASLAGLKPVVAGRFFVHGAHDRHQVPPNARAIEVEAALAFGTGHHGTTRGCLLALSSLLKRTRPRRVLDVGTGSGILAIAAASALRTTIDATDIDPAAIRIARANVLLNRINVFVRVMPATSRLPELGCSGYDLILANILAAPLIRMSAGLARKIRHGGALVLSGLLSGQANAVTSAYRAQGLSLESRIPLDEWVTLVMRRRAVGPHQSKAPRT